MPSIQLPHYIDPAEVIVGVDLYHLSKVNSLHEARAAGVRFAWLKCGESDSILDPAYDDLYARCHEAGIICGPYWFTHADKDPVKQATLLHNHGHATKGDLIAAMDTETLNGQSAAIVGAHAKQFEQATRELSGRGAIAYSSDSFIQDNLIPALGYGVTYWAARYGHLPKTTCRFHQCADGENVTVDIPGLGGPTDVNVFFGSIEELKAGFTYL